ncbi:MAG: FMN-binding protein [Spirochaetaceae bacterium]|nr:MAG: FMN-binding protein [Spirochaetaceae bacterium]
MDPDFLKVFTAAGGLLVASFIVILLALPGAPVEASDTYSGSGEGYYADLTVAVGVSGDRIVSIKVTDHDDTPGLADAAIETVIDRIISAQSTDIDTVSGATYTSKGVIDAVREALQQAGW